MPPSGLRASAEREKRPSAAGVPFKVWVAASQARPLGGVPAREYWRLAEGSAGSAAQACQAKGLPRKIRGGGGETKTGAPVAVILRTLSKRSWSSSSAGASRTRLAP